MNLLVSVVVPTYRRPDLLARCLAALLAQDFDPAAFEVVIADDAQDPQTRRLVEEAAKQAVSYRFQPYASLPDKRAQSEGQVDVDEPQGMLVKVEGLPSIRYIPVIGSHGPAAARNTGWRAALSDIIAFTDDDCLPARDWLKNGLLAFNFSQPIPVMGVTGQVIVPVPEQPSDYEWDTTGLERSEFVTANCFYRRSALEAVHGFDERFTSPWREDSDLYFKLLEINYPLLSEPSALVVHPVRPAPRWVSLKQQRKAQFNALLYKKHPRLYRERIQAAPPWRYYLVLGSLLIALLLALAGFEIAAAAALAVWALLTVEFTTRRLAHTRRDPAHVLEMLVTSALIPPLAVFWRLAGAVRFRVWFI